MPNFRETRACIAYAYGSNFINEQEFVLLYDCHKSTNPEFPYWNYDRFDLDEKSNDECKAEFRFYREDIPLIWYLNYLAKIPEVSRKNFEN